MVFDPNGKYTTTNGENISNADSLEAIRNDYNILVHRYAPNVVSIERMPAKAGEALHLRITVHAPSHYLTSKDDITPKSCRSMFFYLIVYLGYPLKAVRVWYPKDHYLASPNVFRSGQACIDTWILYSSSLLTVADKVIHDIIHDPVVTNYGSPANSDMISWHKSHVAKGTFPTIPPRLLEKGCRTPPPLPTKHRR